MVAAFPRAWSSFVLVTALLASLALAEEKPVAPLPPLSPLAPGAIVALAADVRERWAEPKGAWDFQPNGLVGSGESSITFRGPFQPPFVLSFKVTVLKGMRPRVYLGRLKWANERYDRNFALYPSSSDGEPFSYEEGHEYQIRIDVEPTGGVLSVDGRKIMTSSVALFGIPGIRFSAGDSWSRGTVRFSDIVVQPGAAVAKSVDDSKAVVKVEDEEPGSPSKEADTAARQAVLLALADSQKVALDLVRVEYAGTLAARIAALTAQGDRALAISLRVEKLQVEGGKLPEEEAFTTAPQELLALRAPIVARVKAIKAATEPRIAAVRAGGVKADPGPPHPKTRRTPQVGGPGGGAFEDLGAAGEVLTGFTITTASYGGHLVIASLQSIFRSPAGVSRRAARHGEPEGQEVTVEAAPGYAVGGMKVNTGDRLDGFEIFFVRVKPDGAGLDAADSYPSPWTGGKDGGPGQIEIGHPAVGVFGASGTEIDSIGLIEQITTSL